MQGNHDRDSVRDSQHDKIELPPQSLPFVSYTRPSTYSHIRSCQVSSCTRFSDENTRLYNDRYDRPL
jgi:hypothetical protein